jgi:aminoglycoside phosphotransferase (APT) family kinase protein
MHAPIPAAEVDVDAHLVRRLLRAQHPDLADRRLRRIGTGWDNAVYRLGPDLTVRVPRRELGARLIATELRWVPELAPGLPLPVPTPVLAGAPTDFYPWPWAVCAHVPGRPVGASAFTGVAGVRAARAMAAFLGSLHVPAPSDAPRSPFRGVPLAERSESVARALADAPAAQRSRIERGWAQALRAPLHEGPDMWLHGDLHGLNVLAVRGSISGIIDFGDLCAGDPATDLACAWLLLDHPGRQRMREVLDVDDAAWARGQGWALFLGLMFLVHSADSPVNGAIGRRALGEVLAGGSEGQP